MTKSKRTNFIDACLQGDALLEEIDDYIDIWHKTDGSIPVFKFLGMTEEEYASWVVDAETLRMIVKAHKDQVPFENEVRRQYSLAARSCNPHEAKKLNEWLKRTGRI